MLHNKSHLVRSVLEGVAYNMRHIQEALLEQGIVCDAVRMIGGGAKSRTWRSIFADILEKPIQRLNFIEEATAVGAAIAGGVGVGIISSLEDAGKFVHVVEKTPSNSVNYEIYRRQFRIFKESYRNLKEVFRMLSHG